MTDLEKAIRLMCLCEPEDDQVALESYKQIYKMVHGDQELIDEYAKKYDIVTMFTFT